MTNCQCPAAGFCERHQVDKSKHWHKLCQSYERYFMAWEKGSGPGQSGEDEVHRARRERVIASRALVERFKDWLQFLRIDADSGLGDTAQRLLQACHPSTDARQLLDRVLAECNCTPVDAVSRLNSEHPYAASVVQ